ncbi:MAG TPA: CDP-alcohol phosphatidyltransferase family protein [Frankiaceae bacterium]|nr:CDP-alcohol phosphatidyltransferase family protein [Frankiaceae bacterium]
MSALPDRTGYRARWSELHGGAAAAPSRATAAWLTLVEGAARPLAKRNVSPDVLTAIGVGLAAAAPLAARARGKGFLVAGAAVLASGFADGLDGSVAVLSGADTGWGFVLDSLADRASDALQLLGLRAAGAPPRLTVAAGAGVMLLEYARARAAAAGVSEIGTVTVGERPVRMAVTASAFVTSGFFPWGARVFATAGAAANGALSVAGAAQFLRAVGPRLHEQRPA